jgi:hypothetical protein
MLNPGTLEFLAPEELRPPIRSQRFVHESSYWTGFPVDCWALGVTALELLTGRCLFEPDYSERPVGILSASAADAEWRDERIACLHAQRVRRLPANGIPLPSPHERLSGMHDSALWTYNAPSAMYRDALCPHLRICIGRNYCTIK